MRVCTSCDRVHFSRLDVARHADGGREPVWFAYRTTAAHEAAHGDFLVIEVRADGIEQDFDVPGPYGH
ncbi:MAG: hypothetical protein FJ087_13055 [Deltaproteobacteria bacterium]|nr:hypothetical protein [Deltaproteobacteria bacterium]